MKFTYNLPKAKVMPKRKSPSVLMMQFPKGFCQHLVFNRETGQMTSCRAVIDLELPQGFVCAEHDRLIRPRKPQAPVVPVAVSEKIDCADIAKSEALLIKELEGSRLVRRYQEKPSEEEPND